MIDVKKILQGTPYEDKTAMVQNALNQNGYSNQAGLQNLPRLGLTGVDVYDLLAVMNGRIAELKVAEEAKEAKPAAIEKKSSKKENTDESGKEA